MALVRLEEVQLTYPVYSQQSRAFKHTLLSSLGGKMSTSENNVCIEALRNVSFELNDGDRLGIVGRNGAGKTTLLRAISQIYEPQHGKITIEGKLSCLVDITLGMDPEANGWDNIIFRAAFMGVSFSEARKLSASIAEFSELGEYLDMPVRTYSAGMYMRLAFAITTAIHSDILVMDEMIGAGDAGFLDKAIERVISMMDKTKIVIVATHSNFTISRFCNKALWMDKGQVKLIGPVDEVIHKLEADTLS